MIDVFIDMDSTMNDFAKGYVNYFNHLYKTNHKLRKKNLTRYEISKSIPGISESEAITTRAAIFSFPGFWFDLPIYPNVATTVEWISENFNTYVLTAPWIDYRDCVKEKYLWIEEHLPFIPLNKVIFCHDKHLIHRNSILIDDHANNIGKFQGHTLKYSYPYNENVASNWAAGNWKKVLKVMKSIKKDVDKNGQITKY